MTRLPRDDLPGSWHHVMNRGIARRTLFERRADMRAFLSGVACRVRAGEIEVHAFSLMGTHYHLLVRSPVGRLAQAMQRIQLGYSRAFNRERRRDGPLVRGRYRSKPVHSLTYRRVLVRYIDANPVRARLVVNAGEYPHGSAFHYRRSRGPAWLERSWVEAEVERVTGARSFDPARYARAFGDSTPELERLVEARSACRSHTDPLDDLVKSSGSAVAAWMRRKAALADGSQPGLPVCDLCTVERRIEGRALQEPWTLPDEGRDGWEVARAALSVELCGSTQAAVALRLHCSDTRVGKLLALHRRLMRADASYAARLGELAREALRVWDDVGV